MQLMNEYFTHNENEIDANMSHLQGYIEITYDEIVKKLGEPILQEDGDKSDAEWNICFTDTGTVATIYNWKDGKNYLGADGDIPEVITDWHIGGLEHIAVNLVNELFGRS